MADITREDVDAMVAVLRGFPADGQLTASGDNAVVNCILAGFVERREIEEPCKTCGKHRVTHGYFIITAAGRALLKLADTTEDVHA